MFKNRHGELALLGPSSSQRIGRFLRLVFFILLYVIPGLVAVAGTPPTPAHTQQHLISIKVALEWFLNPHHAPFIIAQTKGYFAEEGLAVDLQPTKGSQQGCLQAYQGSVDFALTHEPQILIMAKKGIHLNAVAVLIPQTLEVVLSNIALDQNVSPQPLMGKVIAHDSCGGGNLTVAMIHQFLIHQHLTEDDVTLLLAKNAVVSGFIAGKIDVVFNVYKTYQLHDIKKHKKQPFFVYELKDFGVPAFASMVLIGSAHVPDMVREKMRLALQKAVNFIHESPAEAFDCVRAYRPELDTSENKEAWPLIHPVFSVDVRPYDMCRDELREFLKEST
jgi:putative hydroxymethylpyrimidine transport system substrate-binding protein